LEAVSCVDARAQVVASVGANDSQPASAGKASTAFNTSARLTAEDLSPGSWYDVYLVAADDPAGNLQPRVTNVS
jgi:hypothetical protein